MAVNGGAVGSHPAPPNPPAPVPPAPPNRKPRNVEAAFEHFVVGGAKGNLPNVKW